MTEALLAVDIQNDFCPGGALAVPGGDQVVPIMNEYARRFANAGKPVFASRDWHPQQTTHFNTQGGIWPPHCVRDTPGARFHPNLQLPAGTEVLSKGTDPREDAYSACQARTADGTPFLEVLRHLGVDHLYVGGLATDYCVRWSALDVRKAGIKVTLLIDATRGVDLQPGDTERALTELLNAGVEVTTLAQLQLEGEQR